jgi:hypothetical protein
MKQNEISHEILLDEGFKYVNKATARGTEFMCFEKGEILLRFRTNGLFQINPNERLVNIGPEIKTISQLKELR